MKRIFYGVLIVALSLAFLSACDDSRKIKKQAECAEGVDCEIDPPLPPEVKALECFDITDVGTTAIPATMKLPDRLIKTDKTGRLLLLFPMTYAKFSSDRPIGLVADYKRPGGYDDAEAPMKKLEQRIQQIKKILDAKNDIIDEFFEIYDGVNVGSIYTEEEINPEEYEFTIVSMKGTKDLFSPEGKCFFVADPEEPVEDDEATE